MEKMETSGDEPREMRYSQTVEYYSAVKVIKNSYATAEETLKVLSWVKEARHKDTVWFLSYETSRLGRSTEI